MSSGASFWYWVIVVALSTYFGLAVVIAIGGFFDVKKMFRRLREAHDQARAGSIHGGSAGPRHGADD